MLVYLTSPFFCFSNYDHLPKLKLSGHNTLHEIRLIVNKLTEELFRVIWNSCRNLEFKEEL